MSEKKRTHFVEWRMANAPVPYLEAVAFMEKRVGAIADEQGPECVWLLEHPPLYTGGTSARAADLLEPRFPVFETGRGGEYTYHGPGQRVAYVMLNLKNRYQNPDLKKYIWMLEDWIIRALGRFDVRGERRPGRVGIWVVQGGAEAKIAAIGVRVRRWVTWHGVSINNDPDLSHYAGIVPCGVREYGVTSLKALGRDVPMADLDAALRETFNQVFGDRVFGEQILDGGRSARGLSIARA